VDLRYLYTGSSDTEADVTRWLLVPGACLRWWFRHFGADVAAVDLGARPFVLIADHRPPGSVLPIYAIPDLDEAIVGLQNSGWNVELGPMGTPEGPACLLRTANGTTVALLQVDRSDAMESAYADETNSHRVVP
jgi:hypothetical protein